MILELKWRFGFAGSYNRRIGDIGQGIGNAADGVLPFLGACCLGHFTRSALTLLRQVYSHLCQRTSL